MHISLSHHSIDHLRQELEKIFLHVPLPLTNHCLVTECVHYCEANGRVELDAIPTAIFPTDPGILSETQAERVCITSPMAS